MFAGPVEGTFILTPAGFDGVYDNFYVTDVNWRVPLNGNNAVVTGIGTYKVGGETNLQQELSLDLQMSDGNVTHFDSGLVAASATFPDIAVDISVNGKHCFDSVFRVSASPAYEH